MYDLKKQQIEQAYKKQQKKIADLEDFVARNKARAATATLARSRQKELDKMDRISLAPEKIKPTFNFRTDRAPGRIVISAKNLVIGYDSPLTKKIDLQIRHILFFTNYNYLNCFYLFWHHP
jgi:ATPase subunit of ABC transporter with duplicated ATPase domains